MDLPENLHRRRQFSLIDRCPEKIDQCLDPVIHVSPGALLLAQCGNKDA